jgi:hypothetical protein
MKEINHNSKYTVHINEDFGWWCAKRDHYDYLDRYLRIKTNKFGYGGDGSYCKSLRHLIRVLKRTVTDGHDWSFIDMDTYYRRDIIVYDIRAI